MDSVVGTCICAVFIVYMGNVLDRKGYSLVVYNLVLAFLSSAAVYIAGGAGIGNHPDRIVLGLPKNMNDTLGERAEFSLAFKEKLERRTGLPVVMWDERLTTVAADKAMMEAGIRREHRKEHVDKIAAIFILQGYLDYLAGKEEREKEL